MRRLRLTLSSKRTGRVFHLSWSSSIPRVVATRVSSYSQPSSSCWTPDRWVGIPRQLLSWVWRSFCSETLVYCLTSNYTAISLTSTLTLYHPTFMWHGGSYCESLMVLKGNSQAVLTMLLRTVVRGPFVWIVSCYMYIHTYVHTCMYVCASTYVITIEVSSRLVSGDTYVRTSVVGELTDTHGLTALACTLIACRGRCLIWHKGVLSLGSACMHMLTSWGFLSAVEMALWVDWAGGWVSCDHHVTMW